MARFLLGSMPFVGHATPLLPIASELAERGHGVGLNLKTATPPPARIRTAVQHVLADRRYRRRAQQLAAEIASHAAPTEAARLLERLVETRRPVLAAA
jgi:UDP:flavonoid glycosyltransferase YjiC (YdhE family)